jgi:hypothetical protein
MIMSNENTEATEQTAPDAVDAESVVESAPAAVVEPVVDEPKAAVVVETPVAPVSSQPKKGGARAASPLGAVVSGEKTDNVSLASCVIKNKFARKSLSVHHVQRRLEELGYKDAAADRDGWYGDLTMKAVKDYQAAEGLEASGVVNMETLNSLFHDDPNVVVIA